MNYSIEEISTFLKLWGTGFKGLDPVKYPNAEAYYQACVDAHQHLNKKPLFFYNLGGLRRTLILIADDFEAEWKSRRQPESYKHRAELLRYIVSHHLSTPVTKVVQKEFFK